MNFLNLVKRTARECGSSDQISTVVDQTGKAQKIVDWVAQAWVEIQNKHPDWSWMRSSVLVGGGVSFTTVAGTGYYALGAPAAGTVGITRATLKRWADLSFRNYPTGTPNGEIRMGCIAFDAWRDSYMFGSQRDARSRPTLIAIGPDQEVCLAPMPGDGWTIIGDYFRTAQVLTVDDDEPTAIPDDYHMAIVYLAMCFYGTFEAAPDVLSRGQVEYGKLIRELESERGPRVTLGGPLA